LLGTNIVVYGIEETSIIKDARGLQSNETIRLNLEK